LNQARNGRDQGRGPFKLPLAHQVIFYQSWGFAMNTPRLSKLAVTFEG
jgi:hypothetical protein